MSQESQGANFFWMGKNLNLLFLCLMRMCCTLQGCCLHGEGMCLPIPVQGNTFPHLACWRWSMPTSELTRLRLRIQDSSWMPWWEDVCFEGVSSPQHSLHVYQCWRFRGRGNMGKISGCVGVNRSWHNGEGKCAEGWGSEQPDPASAYCRDVGLDDL